VSVERADFDSLAVPDLQELIDGQVPEGLRVDYKLTAYGNSDSDKRELLKDVSALANTHGGHLVLGVEENAGVATALVGITGQDPDAEILRMEQIARTGLEPRISGLRMKAVFLASGNQVLVIRVPKSWNPPHRVVAQGSNRFYVRHSAGVHEPSVEELRTLFTQSASALEQARQFRDQRLRFIRDGRGDRPLVGGGRLIVHIVPVAEFSGAIRVDVEQVHARHQAFRPIGSASGMTSRFNYFGFINERGGQENHGYTQVFRNGSLEATMAGIVREYEERRRIPGLAIERYVFEVLSPYVIGLRDIGVPPPLILMITLEGVRGVTYAVRQNAWNDYEPPLPEDLLTLPECILEDYGTEVDHHRAVRPAFDALWNAIGFARSQFFNEEGRWICDGRRG
jgi:hypothetical protein